VIVGGKNSISLVEGEGVSKISEGVKLELKKYYPLGKDFVMEYMVLREG
jgi:riboflavin biosynthesis pyrimidine reductase